MDIHHVTISEVKELLKAQEIKLTNEMNKEIKFRVREEVGRQIEQKNKEIGDTILP